MNKNLIWVLWIFCSTFGWGIVQFFGFQIADIPTWTYVGVYACFFLINSFLIGAVVSVFQYLTLRRILGLSMKWVFATTVGYMFGVPVFFLLFVFLNWLMTGLPSIIENQFVIISVPIHIMMIASGAFISWLQLISGEVHVFTQNFKLKVLWIFGSALGWGIGFYAMAYSRTFGSPIIFQNIFCGLLIGIISGKVLLMVTTWAGRETKVGQ